MGWVKLAVYAVIVMALASAVAWFVHHERDIGRAEVRAELQPKIDTLVGNIAAQKTEAAALLRAETAKVAALQTQLNVAHAAQEKQDAQNKQTIAAQATRLRALAGPAGRLRDPGAPAGCGRGSGGTESQPAAVAAGGAADGAAASGLLSEVFSGFLIEQAADADSINAAYASCRADALSIRAAGP